MVGTGFVGVIDMMEQSVLYEVAAQELQDELSILCQPQSDQFLNLKLQTSTLNLIDFQTNETLPALFPLLSLNPTALPSGLGGQKDRKHIHIQRERDQRKDVTSTGTDNQRC